MDGTPLTGVQPFTANKTSSLAERAYRRLLDAIVEALLSGGASVSERSLSSRLSISAQLGARPCGV